MTQEEKQILLQDLCSRLPYKTKVNVDDSGLFIPRLRYIDGITCYFYECAWTKFIDEIKPYLRPLSSMTEEESKEFALLQTDFYVDGFLYPIAAINMVNWLNSHYFDYRGLIERGLALEALEGMYR